MRVSHQRAGKQADLGEDLESVADAENESAAGGVTPDRLHDRSEFRERAGAEIVAIREPAGDDDAVDAFEVGVFVPEHFRFRAEEVARDVERVVIAVGTGQNDDAEFHSRFSVLSSRFSVSTPRTENREPRTNAQQLLWAHGRL